MDSATVVGTTNSRPKADASGTSSSAASVGPNAAARQSAHGNGQPLSRPDNNSAAARIDSAASDNGSKLRRRVDSNERPTDGGEPDNQPTNNDGDGVDERGQPQWQSVSGDDHAAPPLAARPGQAAAKPKAVGKSLSPSADHSDDTAGDKESSGDNSYDLEDSFVVAPGETDESGTPSSSPSSASLSSESTSSSDETPAAVELQQRLAGRKRRGRRQYHIGRKRRCVATSGSATDSDADAQEVVAIRHLRSLVRLEQRTKRQQQDMEWAAALDSSRSYSPSDEFDDDCVDDAEDDGLDAA